MPPVKLIIADGSKDILYEEKTENNPGPERTQQKNKKTDSLLAVRRGTGFDQFLIFMVVSLVQFLKALGLIVLTLSERVTVVSDLQFSKADCPI